MNTLSNIRSGAKISSPLILAAGAYFLWRNRRKIKQTAEEGIEQAREMTMGKGRGTRSTAQGRRGRKAGSSQAKRSSSSSSRTRSQKAQA